MTQSDMQARNRGIVGIVMILVSLGTFTYNWRWIRSAIDGPVPITLAELRQLKDPASLPNPWISFTCDKSLETGVHIDNVKRSAQWRKSNFLLVEVQDRWLIAEVPPSHSGKEFVGYLDTWKDSMRVEAVDMVKKNMEVRDQWPPKQVQIMPYQLNTEYSYRGNCIGLCVLLGIVFIVGAGMVYATWLTLTEGSAELEAGTNQQAPDQQLPDHEVACPECKGTGGWLTLANGKGKVKVDCQTCRGCGWAKASRTHHKAPCPECKGRGGRWLTLANGRGKIKVGCNTCSPVKGASGLAKVSS